MHHAHSHNTQSYMLYIYKHIQHRKHTHECTYFIYVCNAWSIDSFGVEVDSLINYFKMVRYGDEVPHASNLCT